MALDIKDRRVLVVGAAGGMGAKISRAFAAAGAKVSAAGRPGDDLDKVADEIAGVATSLDFLDTAAVDVFFEGEEPFHHVVIAAARTGAWSCRRSNAGAEG